MPILFTQKSPVIGIWKITEPWHEMLESLQENDLYLNHVHNRDIYSIKSDKRKQEWLAVRLLLKHMAGIEAYIEYNKDGAPVLRNNPYNISISHTTGFAAVILSKNDNPGIDIEYHSVRAWKLREKFLSEKELEMFNLLNDSLCRNKQTDYSIKANYRKQTGNNLKINGDKKAVGDKFSMQAKLATVCWCAKETVFKAMLQTEVDFINHLHIMPFSLSEKDVISLKETKTSKQQVFNINFQITEDFIITWKE